MGTSVAVFKTASANCFAAITTARDAIIAKAIEAGFATLPTALTHRVLASRATVSLVFRSVVSAFAAFHAVPLLQRDIGTCCVVGLKRLVNDREEIVETPIGKCLSDRPMSIALAKRIIAHVWVSCSVSSGVTAVFSDHFIR